MTKETLTEMKAKHPEAELPTVPSGSAPTAVRFDTELVQEGQWLPHWIGRWCLWYAPSVPQGHSIMHQKGCLGRSADEFDGSQLSPFIAGAPLMALAKLGELRPIAIGETIRRLVSKCCCEATTEDAKIIFGPLQVGVATQGGAEASVHAARKLAKEFGEDPGKIMLKVDFFECVQHGRQDRDARASL